jgi:hypothetical protein
MRAPSFRPLAFLVAIVVAFLTARWWVNDAPRPFDFASQAIKQQPNFKPETNSIESGMSVDAKESRAKLVTIRDEQVDRAMQADGKGPINPMTPFR